MTNPSIVSPSEIKKSDSLVIDVRTPAEHDEKRLAQPHDHVPLDRLDPKEFMLKKGLDKDACVYILCRSGGRARTAAEKFVSAGYQNIKVIDGGLNACESSGIPVAGSSGAANSAPLGTISLKIPPLECQVRIAAGGGVMLGILLGAAIHPVLYLLPFGIGAGLVYSGVTNTCGISSILMKAPWNKGTPSASACTMKTPSKMDKTSSGGGCA